MKTDSHVIEAMDRIALLLVDAEGHPFGKQRRKDIVQLIRKLTKSLKEDNGK
jgi:glutamate racemase